MSASQNNSAPDQGKGGSWAGWILIGAVILIMGFAVMLSVRQLTEAPPAPDPLTTPKPKIGSMLVESEVDSFDGDSRFDTTSESGDETGVEDTDSESAEAQAVSEATAEGSAATGEETEATTTSTIGGTTIGSPSLEEEATPPAASPARELVIVSGIEALLSGATSVELPIEIALAPTATEYANRGAVETEVATAAFGRVAVRQGVSQTVEPPATATSVASGTRGTSTAEAVVETPSPEASATPVPTDTATAVPTGTPTDTPSPMPTSTPTVTPTVTPTDTPVPTATSTPTPADTDTPMPTSTETPVPTATETLAPTNTPEPTATPTVSTEDLPVQLPPGSIVVGKEPDLGMYADTSAAAAIMATYKVGAEFSVMEPMPPFDSYPVLANGVAWLRVRAEDGLVGWINAAFVSVNN